MALAVGVPIRPIFIMEFRMNSMLRTVILVLVILLLLGTLPTWPYSAGWGYYPSGGLGLVLVILVILLLAGKL
jgi:Protein of unknown function (DUF3309)